MPPHTPEEQAAEQALDDKLGAAFVQETAALPDTSVEEAEPEKIEEVIEEAADEVEETAETPRDEKGRFVSQDPDVEGYLAKYGGDVEKAIKAATEAQSLIGRQGSELGELRKQFEEFQQVQQKPRYDANALAQLIENDPARATALAYEAGDGATVAAALEAWKEEAPFEASIWVNDVRNAEFQRQITEQMQSANAPLQERAAGQDFQQALTNFALQHPDMDQHVGTMQAIASESPRILKILAEDSSPEAKMEVYDYLYQKARGRSSETLAKAVANTAQEEKQANEAAKQQAAVASATSSTETKKKSRTDNWHSQFSEFLQDDSTSISSGLTTG